MTNFEQENETIHITVAQINYFVDAFFYISQTFLNFRFKVFINQKNQYLLKNVENTILLITLIRFQRSIKYFTQKYKENHLKSLFYLIFFFFKNKHEHQQFIVHKLIKIDIKCLIFS